MCLAGFWLNTVLGFLGFGVGSMVATSGRAPISLGGVHSVRAGFTDRRCLVVTAVGGSNCNLWSLGKSVARPGVVRGPAPAPQSSLASGRS